MEIDVNGVKITLTQDQLNEIQRQTQKLTKETKEDQMEKEFLDMWNGCVIHFDFEKYPESIFLMKDGEYFFEQDWKNKRLWCSIKYVWSIFESKYGLERNEIQLFIKAMVEKHFKLGGLTAYLKIDTLVKPVEKHFKLGGLTAGLIPIMITWDDI